MVPETSNCDVEYIRPVTSFVNNCQRFFIQDRTFERQYAKFYTSRLKISTNALLRQIEEKWGASANVKPLCDITGNEQVVVIGTLFKHMELHPSILKEISEERNIIPQPVTEEFSGEDDYLILEDDLQRVVLTGNMEPHSHVTGINVAVKGYTEESGKFFVEDYCYPFVNTPKNLPLFTEDRFVLLLSGLEFGNQEVSYPLQILQDCIIGGLGSSQDQQKFSHIVRIIIAGNSIIPKQLEKLFKAKFLTRKGKSESVENVRMLDDFLSQLAPSVDIDIMPGEHDPANHLLPQKPLSPIMFPKSSQLSTFNVLTNPYDATIDGVRFIGSSGQNIQNIRAFSKMSDTLDVMQKTLDWGHLAPTAPDSLNCYPFLDEDPFILTEHPHVYFCGNAPEMGFRYHDSKKVLLVAIPKFQKTFCGLLLNLKNLKVEPLILGNKIL